MQGRLGKEVEEEEEERAEQGEGPKVEIPIRQEREGVARWGVRRGSAEAGLGRRAVRKIKRWMNPGLEMEPGLQTVQAARGGSRGRDSRGDTPVDHAGSDSTECSLAATAA